MGQVLFSDKSRSADTGADLQGEYLELYPPGGTKFLTRLGSRGVQVENVSLLCASNPCN